MRNLRRRVSRNGARRLHDERRYRRGARQPQPRPCGRAARKGRAHHRYGGLHRTGDGHHAGGDDRALRRHFPHDEAAPQQGSCRVSSAPARARRRDCHVPERHSRARHRRDRRREPHDRLRGRMGRDDGRPRRVRAHKRPGQPFLPHGRHAGRFGRKARGGARSAGENVPGGYGEQPPRRALVEASHQRNVLRPRHRCGRRVRRCEREEGRAACRGALHEGVHRRRPRRRRGVRARAGQGHHEAVLL